MQGKISNRNIYELYYYVKLNQLTMKPVKQHLRSQNAKIVFFHLAIAQ
jgi:hypothetical protein